MVAEVAGCSQRASGRVVGQFEEFKLASAWSFLVDPRQILAPLVNARGFGMTLLKKKKERQTRLLPLVGLRPVARVARVRILGDGHVFCVCK